MIKNNNIIHLHIKLTETNITNDTKQTTQSSGAVQLKLVKKPTRTNTISRIIK